MKKCTICKEEKDLTCFNKSRNRYDGLQSECRECSKIRSKERYEKHKEKMIYQINEARVKRLNKHRELLYEILSNSSCVDCGNNNPLVLDFDHKDYNDKFDNISVILHSGYSWDNILKEIEKCDIRCANCHRIKTAHEQNWFKLKKNTI